MKRKRKPDYTLKQYFEYLDELKRKEMSNHSWNKDNVCKTCGIRRELKMTGVYSHSFSYLSKSGIWEDKHVTNDRPRYHYYDLDGQSIGTDRPECKK